MGIQRRGPCFAVAALGPFVALVSCGFDGVGRGQPGPVGGAGAEAGSDDSAAALTGDGGDVSAGDGAADGSTSVPCPPVCNDGCAGGECRIKNPSGPIACPPGMSCRVHCSAKQVCRDVDCSAATRCALSCTTEQACESLTLTCGGGPCTVSCTGEEACKNLSIAPPAASQLCVGCSSGDSCAGVACVAPAASGRACAGSCNGVSNCGSLASVTGCP